MRRRRHWLVVVDLAPPAVVERVVHALRDLGFVEVVPMVFRDEWLPIGRARLVRQLQGARRRGVGAVLVAELGRSGAHRL